MMNTLLVSRCVLHPPLTGRWALEGLLNRLEGIQWERVPSLESLTRISLKDVKALILLYHRKRISPQALDAFRSYVLNGGGVLAIHSATASFKKVPGYAQILGGAFAGHGPVSSFEITASQEKDEIFGSIPVFQVTDELYLHDLEPGLRVHFQAELNGKKVPVVWTQSYGKGRVCYVCPGHRSASFRSPQIQDILKKGLQWVL